MLRIATVLAAVLGLLVVPGAAHAAAPDTEYYVSGYADTQASGTIIWHNRSVRVGGRVYAPNGCARVVYHFYSDGLHTWESRTSCSGSKGHGFTEQLDEPGGVTDVYAVFSVWSPSEGWVHQETDHCTRSGCRTYRS